MRLCTSLLPVGGRPRSLGVAMARFQKVISDCVVPLPVGHHSLFPSSESCATERVPRKAFRGEMVRTDAVEIDIVVERGVDAPCGTWPT